MDLLKQELGGVKESEAREAVKLWIILGTMEYVDGVIRRREEPIPNCEYLCNAVYNAPRSDKGRTKKGKGRLALQ